MKIFISMPMHGRSDECIKARREEIIKQLKDMFGLNDTPDRMSFYIPDLTAGRAGKYDLEKAIKLSTDIIDAQGIEVINNFTKVIPDDVSNKRIWCLGDSISLMQNADLVVFPWDWMRARGCNVEMEVCKQYDIPFIVLGKTDKDLGEASSS